MVTKISAPVIVDGQQTDDATRAANLPQLKELEQIIQRGEDAFLSVAKAVFKIVKDELFRPDFKDKTTYFVDVWCWLPQTVTKYEHAGHVLNVLEAEGLKLPTIEGHCRELYSQAKGDEAKIIGIWETVLADGGRITGKLIAEKAKNLYRPSVKEEQEEPQLTPSVQIMPETRPVSGRPESRPEREEPPISGSAPLSTIRGIKPYSAMVTVTLPDSTLADALEYRGIPCEKVDDGWRFPVHAMGQPALLSELSSWVRAYEVTSMLIDFGESSTQ